MNTKVILTLVSLLLVAPCFAQVPVPAKPQKEAIILKGGTAHVGNGQIIENSFIKLENGKITAVGKNDNTSVGGAKVIDVTGKQVYPGVIAPNTILGLSEIDAARATQDNAEVGAYNPNVRSIIAYNTDSKIIPTIRSNGILLAEIAPIGGVISGSSSVVELDGWNWEDAAYKMDIGLHLNWPGIYKFSGWWGEPGPTEINKDYDKAVDQIKEYFAQAKAYAQSSVDRPVNQKFEAMKGLFDKSKKLFVQANSTREILAVIDFNKIFGLDLILVCSDNVLPVAGLIKENHIPLILTSLHRLPDQPEDDIDITFKAPYLLKQAGVDFCLSLGGSWQQRNLPFIAGTAAAYGLTKEEALASITGSTARILGIDKNVGTLETGKDATIIVSSGDLLDMKTSNVEFAFIRGKQIDLDNSQKALYRKFEAKYHDQQ